LRDYATRAGAGPGWLFVTGSRDALTTLLRDGFKVAWADDGPPTSPITHSDRFVLVDRDLRIRGYYHGTDPADVARLGRDAAALLGTPTLLAATIPPLAIVTLSFALGARFARHARLARWTLPLWFYVSVTGVAIYVMLYVLYPASAAS